MPAAGPVHYLSFAMVFAGAPLFSQCYDLTASRLYETHSRFEEHWDRPVWNAPPGSENFHVENEGFGRALQFAIFTVGTIRKTPQGWVPYRAERVPNIFYDLTPERSGGLAYMASYAFVPPTAVLEIANKEDVETWTLSMDGLLRYTRKMKSPAHIVRNAKKVALDSVDFGTQGGGEDNEALLDLNTGEFHYVQHSHCDGCYVRRVRGGLKLWRTIRFDAKARLREVPCPVSLRRAIVPVNPELRVEQVELSKVPEVGVCAARVDTFTGIGTSAVPKTWEFLQNPLRLERPDTCVLLFSGPPPDGRTLEIAIVP